MISFIVFKIVFGSEELLSNSTLQKLLRAFTTAVAIIIVCVPEGLPLAVSIAMAFSVDMMKEDKLLVKKMAACENLAFTNTICTGKTGTLTQGSMKVKQFFVGAMNYNFEQENLDKIDI
jgi:P-type E1-E2 ATPase